MQMRHVSERCSSLRDTVHQCKEMSFQTHTKKHDDADLINFTIGTEIEKNRTTNRRIGR